ncbi:hypothetical protein B4U80_03046 [Leptotrombidium deliense]|uniref:Uncharacterized protein n=1 Tax=Leptotrombidium deliense TaxID=299467 RepID=A0A443S360_9ACAR|nr:hypothetical protein B4U80_03046 [Leptotrombidium deliense]
MKSRFCLINEAAFAEEVSATEDRTIVVVTRLVDAVFGEPIVAVNVSVYFNVWDNCDRFALNSKKPCFSIKLTVFITLFLLHISFAILFVFITNIYVSMLFLNKLCRIKLYLC